METEALVDSVMQSSQQELLEDTLLDDDEVIMESSAMEYNQILEHIMLYQLPFLCYPMFELAHFLITTAKIRSEFGLEVSRSSPLSSLLSVVISCVAGSLLTNMLLGLPVADAFKNETNLVMILIVWLAIFYCPNDVVYKLVNMTQISSFLWSLKEIDRMKKIVSGVGVAGDMYPGNVLLTSLCGVLKGCGTSIIKPVARSLSSSSSSGSSINELTSPGTMTKLTWLASIGWVCVHHLPGAGVNVDICIGLYNTCTTVFLVYRLECLVNLSSIITNISEYYDNTENNNKVTEDDSDTAQEDINKKKE